MTSPDRLKRLVAADGRHVVHPFSQIASTEITPSTMYVGGEGCYVRTASGDRLFDANAGLGCVNVGYGRDEIADAIRDQAAQLGYFQIFGQNATLPSAELAAKLAELAPGDLNRVVFSTGGSLANETAVRVAHHYFRLQGKHDKKQIISVAGAYHGSGYLTASMTQSAPEYRELFHTAESIVHVAASPNAYRAPEGVLVEDFLDYLVDDLERLIAKVRSERIACFILEPILGTGGAIVPPDGYHAQVAEICRENEILVIADEVVTGFGRLGEFFAGEPLFDFVADMVTVGKGISSGYLPLAATLISDEIYEVIGSSKDPDVLFAHGFTYSGHPACCAAGLKNIDIMEREDLCGNVREVGMGFQADLRALREAPIVGDVRGRGFMAAVELVRDKTSKEPFPVEVEVAKRVEAHCRVQGLIVRGLGAKLVLGPPLVMTADQATWVVDTLRSGLEHVTDDLLAAGALD